MLEVQSRRESSNRIHVHPSWGEADTVSDEKLSGASDSVLSERYRMEDRVLMTLNLDCANVQACPPKSHPGIVVFRPESQDKPRLLLF
jgi:hypothetical protein